MFVSNPGINLCGWLCSKHQLTKYCHNTSNTGGREFETALPFTVFYCMWYSYVGQHLWPQQLIKSPCGAYLLFSISGDNRWKHSFIFVGHHHFWAERVLYDCIALATSMWMNVCWHFFMTLHPVQDWDEDGASECVWINLCMCQSLQVLSGSCLPWCWNFRNQTCCSCVSTWARISRHEPESHVKNVGCYLQGQTYVDSSNPQKMTAPIFQNRWIFCS